MATVPTDKVWLVRDISIVNVSTTAAGGASIGIGGIGAGQAIHSTAIIPASEAAQVELWQVLVAGESIYGKKLGSSGSVTLTVSGYELDA